MTDFSASDFFDVLVDSSIQGIFVILEGKFIFTNQRAVEITGYSQFELSEFSAEDIIGLVHKDDIPNVMYYAEKYNKKKNVNSKLEYRFRHKSGVFKWIECLTKSVAHGNKIYLVQLVLDITEKKSAEEKIVESEKKYKNFIKLHKDGIFFLEFKEPINIKLNEEEQIHLIYKHGYITECNISFAIMYGMKSLKEMTGKRLIDIHGGSENDINLNAFREFIGKGYKSLDIETEEVKRNGERVCFLNNSFGIVKNGFLYGIWGVQKNITEIKKSENRQNAAYKISEAVHKAEDLNELYRSVHEIVGSLMPAKNFYIALYDRKSDLISFPYFVDEFDKRIESKKPSKGATEYILKTGKPLLANPGKFKELEKSGEIELTGKYSMDWLGVPLISEGITFGVIVVQSYSKDIEFTEDDMDMLEFVADRTTLAIERKKSIEENAYLNKILRSVSKSEEILLIEQNVNKAIQSAIKIIGESTSADRVSIFENTYDENVSRHLLIRKYEWSPTCSIKPINDNTSTYGLKFIGFDDVFHRWYSELSKGKIISGLLSDFPEYERKTLANQGLKSILLLPIMVGGHSWGFAGLENYTKYKIWDTSEKTILKSFANSIGGLFLRDKTETSLRFSESKNKALLSALPDLMFVLTRDGIFLDYHARDDRMLFLPPVQFLGKNISEVLPENIAKDFMVLTDKIFSEDKLQTYEYKINLSGIEYYYEARMVAHDNDKILTIIRDVSPRVKLYAELKSAKEKAEEMNRIKTNFLANMSHELRTPLHGILGFAQVLMEEINNTEYRNMSEIIYKSGNRLLDTLNMFLNFSKAEAKKINVNYSTFNVIEVIEEVSKLFESFAKNKGLFLVNDFRDSLIYARLDEKLLREIMTNLVNNAIKFTEKGGITLIVESRDENLILKVADTGTGIPDEKQSVIFEEFRQESEGMSRSFEGTGLGLTITKKFVNLMNGAIKVESKPGSGSTFIVTLPIGLLSGRKFSGETDKPESNITEITNLQEENEIIKKKLSSVLLIENDFVCIQLIRKYLRNLYNLEYVTDGNSAVNIAREKHFDVILMDINLGSGMNGIEVSKIIKAFPGYERTPVIAVTAFAMTTDKEEFLNAGCSFYLAKPYEKTDLLNILEKALAKDRVSELYKP